MTKEQAIITAAKWWSNKLRQKPRHDNGDSGLASLFACAIADSCMTEITEEQLKKFEEALVEELLKKLSSCSFTYLDTDYDPNDILCAAANKAGISTMNFPYKITVCVEKTSSMSNEFRVGIRDGYRAPWEYPEPWNEN